MKLGALFARMDTVFPRPVAMDHIRRMKRRKLTEFEKSRPYSRYYFKELADIPAADLDKVNAGPVDNSKALPVQDRDKLMNPGYLDVETGYTVMPDGSGFAATLVKMPGVTPEMLDWWFNWHQLEGLRYAIWCPVAHTNIRVKNPERHYDSSGVPMRERNYGSIHFPEEGFNVDGAQTVRIEFFSPKDYGLNMSLFKEPGISTAYCANVILQMMNIRFNTFFHAVRKVEGGVEFRSRYWLGYTMKDGQPIRVKLALPYKIIDLARNNCLHSLMEYNNLASFLPELYREMGGKIEDPKISK